MTENNKTRLHVHVHDHGDGVVHNHYHQHSAGDIPHEHEHPLPQKAILKALDISFSYPKQNELVFEHINMEARAGSSLAILGNNGAGKSTLLNILAGVARPTKGTVTIGQSDITKMSRMEIARHVAYVSQQQRVPHLSVYDQVLLGRRPHITWGITDYDRLVVSSTIEQLGLERFASRYVDELSEGERQKVHIARAIAQEPEVLLLDEPTSALDPKNQMEVLEIVRRITRSSSLATVIVMHDINLSLRFCDRFLMVHNGDVIAYGNSDVISSETLSSTYDFPLHIENFDGTLMAIPAKS